MLSAKNITKSFGDGSSRRQVLSEVSIDVKPGEIVSVVGRSGAGKSTLLRILGGLLTPDLGTVTAAGLSAQAARAEKTFGLMPQSPALLPWRNVEQNVGLPAQVNKGHGAAPMEVAKALESVGLGSRAKSMPRELSGGMRQRVAVARALATQAPVLLLDEPFSSLDEMTRGELYNEVLRIWNDGHHTVVLVTHNITEAVLLSDRVVVLAGAPSRIVDTVEIEGARPRVKAIDSGAYAECVTRLRSALGEVVQ